MNLPSLSLFEAGMICCFAASWPFALYKTYKSKKVEGVSIRFLGLVILGYLFGIIHKILYSFDIVIILYIISISMVSTQAVFYFMYKDNK